MLQRKAPLGFHAASSRIWDAALAAVFFAIMLVRPKQRVYYGQQFLYKTEGDTFERSFAAFRATVDGPRLLEQRPNSVALLRDRARLQALPEGSLGRSYVDFMKATQIDEDLYLDGVIEAGQRFERDPDRAWFRIRVEVSHDMRHLLTGYGTDLFGETCLLLFRFGQTRHVGTLVFAGFALLMLVFRREPGLMPALREAYRRGRTARLLDLLPWEWSLEKPLLQIQREFGIETPGCYPEHGGIVAKKVQIDICQTFGPLAAMHAALDREGIGMPCGVVACFADKNEREVDLAIAIARRQFPVLQTRLAWQNDRPVLVRGDSGTRDRAANQVLDFSTSRSGEIWRYRLIRKGRNTWLQAAWMHGVADGLSMLHFVKAIAATLHGEPYVPELRVTRKPTDQQRFLAWLPRFWLDQRRANRANYVGLGQPAAAVSQVSWLCAPAVDRERVMDLASKAGEGMAGWLAAAVTIAFAEQQGKPGGNIFLNVPIARNDLEQTNGFGFGLGSLRFPVRPGIDPSMMMLARAIGRRLRQLANRGWDRNLERLLGFNPARHLRFARIEAARSTDPNVTISWKGHHPDLGADGGPGDVACFAAAPTLHVSAHTDARGLSLSVTSRQSAKERRALLLRIASKLGCETELLVRELDDLGAHEDDVKRNEIDRVAVA